MSGLRPAGNGLLNSSKGQTVSQAGNSLPVCVISGPIISDQCRLCSESPCARPLPTLMTDATSVPWAGRSLEHQLVQVSSFTSRNKDISKVTQAASQNYGLPCSRGLRSHDLEQALSTFAWLTMGGGWIILYLGGSSVPCRMFSSILTLCPLDICSTVHDNQQCL